MTHSFYVVMGGFALKEGAILRPVKPTDFPGQVGQQFAFPMISEEELKDKSKGDGLTKTLAIFQLLWFAVQLIGRLAKGWAATELEVLTFATCLMTLVIYFFWWDKGLDVRCQTVLDPIHEIGVNVVADVLKTEEDQQHGMFRPLQVVVIISRCDSEPEKKPTFFTSHPKPQHRFHRLVFDNKIGFEFLFKIIIFPFIFVTGMFGEVDPANWGPDCANPISPHAPSDRQESTDWDVCAFFLSASIFGAMHFITWSFTMPTLAELKMWRFASIALTALPVAAIICFAALLKISHRGEDINEGWQICIGILLIVCIVPHPAIRLVITVDSVALLRNLPDTAFLVFSWSNAIPSL